MANRLRRPGVMVFSFIGNYTNQRPFLRISGKCSDDNGLLAISIACLGHSQRKTAGQTQDI